MERSFEGYLNSENFIKLSAQALMKSPHALEQTIHTIVQNCASNASFKGYLNRQELFESIIRYAQDPMEALIICAVAFDSLFFMSCVTRNIMDMLPQYKRSLLVPSERAWSQEYQGLAQKIISDPTQKEMCEAAFNQVMPYLQALIQSNDPQSAYNELLSTIVELTPLELIGVMKMAC